MAIRDVESILEQVEKIKTTVKSKRVRRKVAALVFGNVHASALQKCMDDLDWAVKEFSVSHLFRVTRASHIHPSNTGHISPG